MADFRDTFGLIPIVNIDPKKLATFVTEHFDEAHSELEDCELSEWKPNPAKIMSIRDPYLRAWALKVHKIWKTLCRKMKEDVKDHPDRHSLLYVKHPFIVPGGRFQEFYVGSLDYWDTYWIVRGLMVSELYNTAKDMIRNFVSIIKTYDFVPNGGRVYYLARSQPPMLTPMVYEIWKATKDIAFVKEVLPTLEKEFLWWDTNRKFSITGPDGAFHNVYQYNAHSNVPRPESYKEDVATCSIFQGDRQASCYQDIATGAESGWDFSSRWLASDWTKNNISSIRTRQVFPVDLNAILCWNMEILQLFYSLSGNVHKATIYEQRRQIFRRSFSAVFYNQSVRAWLDWDREASAHHSKFFASTAVPLFTGCYQSLNVFKPKDVYDYMKNQTALSFPSGVPTSLSATGQQWDLPNGWPPLQHMIIEGFRKSKNPLMQEEAFDQAQAWVLSNIRAYNNPKFPGFMYEKYNVTDPSARPGAGGEYPVQDGFGWTNGVVLDLLYSYSDRMTYQSESGAVAFAVNPIYASGIAFVCVVCQYVLFF